MIEIDVLEDNILQKVNGLINKKRKTIIFAEALTPYFDKQEFNCFMNNVKHLMLHVPNSQFLLQEKSLDKKKSMTPGIGGKAIRFFYRAALKNKSHTHFNSENELMKYLRKKGFKRIRSVGTKEYPLYLISLN